MKPIVVAEHGSENASICTKENVEIQGLNLWLSDIGRPPGNTRTERVIGTLKREEINLQEKYANETETKVSVAKTIWDYHMSRPNQGNGGFAANAAHHIGRAKLMKCIFPRAWNFSCWAENVLGLLGRRAPRIQDLRFAQTVMLIAYYGFWDAKQR